LELCLIHINAVVRRRSLHHTADGGSEEAFHTSDDAGLFYCFAVD
jgi:hypothetical protein